jgi:two-component system sensor histidine kinase YesM
MSKERLKEVQQGLMEYGRLERNQEGRGGIALNNINQRIKMIYGEDYGLIFSSMLGVGTEAELVLPLIEKEKVDAYER